VAVAAGLAAALALPAFTRRAPRVSPEEVAAALAAAGGPPAWEAPDPDDLLEVADLALEPAAGEADVVLAAAEGWAELVPDSK
jgi:hypothetical protein